MLPTRFLCRCFNVQQTYDNARKLPKQERSRITVEAILEATTHILVEEGYDKANTNRIAERAGISLGSLYQYFPNKEALMTALMDQHATEMAELVGTKLDRFETEVSNLLLAYLTR